MKKMAGTNRKVPDLVPAIFVSCPEPSPTAPYGVNILVL